MNAGRTGVEALSSMISFADARSRRLGMAVILAVAAWVSALPFALLLIVPRVGGGSGIAIAIGLLVWILLLCGLWPSAGPDSPRFTVMVSADRPEVREQQAHELSGENVDVIRAPVSGRTAPATRIQVSDRRRAGRPAPRGRGPRARVQTLGGMNSF